MGLQTGRIAPGDFRPLCSAVIALAGEALSKGYVDTTRRERADAVDALRPSFVTSFYTARNNSPLVSISVQSTARSTFKAQAAVSAVGSRLLVSR